MSSTWLKIGHWFYVNTSFGRWYFNRSLDQVSSSYPLGHSAPVTLDYGVYHLRIVSYSKDNYGFVGWRDNSRKCFIVDPGYFPPFQEAMKELHLYLDSVLITHKHIDHCGGLDSIKVLYPNVKVFAHKKEKVKLADHLLRGSLMNFTICEEDNLYPIYISAYNKPGHTHGHTVYVLNTAPYEFNYEINDLDYPLLVFTGDMIFVGSIGAMFEGSLQTNVDSIRGLVEDLLKFGVPANKILLFPGHEYSLVSLEFIVTNCSPFSQHAKQKLEWCNERRNWRMPTIPVSLYEELSYSPYLRIAVATKTTQNRIPLTILTDFNSLTTIYLPTLTEVMNEFLLSERFVKVQVRSTENNQFVDEDILRLKLFDDVFSVSKKILLRCEHCTPQAFANGPDESTLPPSCPGTSSS